MRTFLQFFDAIPPVLRKTLTASDKAAKAYRIAEGQKDAIQSANVFSVQIYCTGLGWQVPKLYAGFMSLAEAETACLHLARNESIWINPDAPRMLRIVPVIRGN